MALTAGKAKKMLDDGTVHGRPLTDKQKRYFGAIAGGATPMKKINGGWLDKYAMGGSLPGASGMMYGRSNTMPPLFTQSEMKAPSFADSLAKAQTGSREFPVREIAIDNTAVRPIRIPIIDKEPKKVPVVQRTQPMLSQDNRSYEQRRRDQEDYDEDNLKKLPLNAMPLTYLSNPFRGIGDVYNNVVQPLVTDLFSTSTLQPLTGNFWTSDEVARELNLRNIQRQRGQITPGEQLSGNFMQALPETGWATANVFGGQLLKGLGTYGKEYLKRIPGYNYLRNTYNYFTRPFGEVVPIGREVSVPSFLTRGKTPPNKLLTNPKVDADNFMQQWTNAPGFNERFYSQIKSYNPLPYVRPETIERTLASRQRELQALQQELTGYVRAGTDKAMTFLNSSEGRYLQQQVDDLTREIDGIYSLYYPKIAIDNMKLIQSGKFPTVYSTSGFSPGSGGTYYVPHAGKPLNTLKIFDDAANIGNKSVVKLREVPVGTNPTRARTEEMLTGIHETLGHASNVGGRALNMETKELIKGALKPNPRISQGTNDRIKSFLGPDATFDDWAKYLQDPTEMIARVMELRRQYINPKYWGTSKQYDVPDKLIDQMFRDGLSGKGSLSPDFFRVVDKEGLKKLMKGLYATIPMAIGADGLLEYETPKYKDGGKAQNGEVLGFDNVLDYVVKTRGGDRDTWGAVADTIAFHESGPRQRMNPEARQYPKGPGRGVFQFEGPSLKTAQNRYKTVANVMGVGVNPNILNATSADQLSLEDQYTLFYVNMLEGPAELGKYPKGEIDIIDLWLDGHKLIESPGNRESFLESQREAQEKGIEGGYKSFRTGGWLEKYEVIEDDMGQLTNPGKITKINSNNITMKGVDFPVLGISDTGDKKMMLPGKDYKFDGSSVTEYPMAQEGGGLNEEGVNQYQFLKSYMNSQMYQDRLKKEFPNYTDKQIAEEAKTRLNNVMQTRVGFLPESSDYSTSNQDIQGVYNRFGNRSIQFRPEYSALTPENPLFDYNTTPIHEFAHAADEGGDRIPQSTKDLIFRSTKDNSLGIPKQEYYYTQPTEVLGRMQELRYLLKDQDIYDARKDIFTQEDLDKARKNFRIKTNARFQDLEDSVISDEALIDMMNSIAAVNQDNKQQTMTAKQGRSLVTLDQLTNFTNYNTPQPGGWLDKYN